MTTDGHLVVVSTGSNSLSPHISSRSVLVLTLNLIRPRNINNIYMKDEVTFFLKNIITQQLISVTNA